MPGEHGFVVAETLEQASTGDDRPTRQVASATIGRFVLLRKLGEGGMGEVFSAYDEQLDRRVAIKLLHASGASDATRLCLLREAQALARLSHPNVVAIHEVGTTADGDVFAVMEHIEGTTLREWQAGGRPAAELLAAYGIAARGLAAVHAAGMVHRDFKPANVMVDRAGRVRLLDFGLAHARLAPADGSETVGRESLLAADLTAAGSLVGTPAYMSPEQFMHEPVGPAADQFSFCVALHEALFEMRPFAGDTVSALVQNVCAGQTQAPPVRPDVPPRVTAALLRGLSRAPSDRFPGMAELADALDPRPDPSGQRRELIVGVAMIVGMLAAWTTFVEVFGAGDSMLTVMLPPAVLAVVVLGAVAFRFRDTLLRNPFHRARLLTILVTGLAILVSRILGLRNDEPMASVAIRDMLVCGGVLAVVAVWATPRTWYTIVAAVVPFLGIALIFWSTDHIAFAATLALDLPFLLFLVGWYASGRQKPGARDVLT